MLLALAASTAAHPESAAPSLDSRVLFAGHTPEPVMPGTQWVGQLQLRPDANVSSVGYQVCNVSDGVCFAPLHPARDLGNGSYEFDTSDYLGNGGQPVQWEAGWRVGVRWFLRDAAGNGTWVPPQEGDTIESHYLAFDIPQSKSESAPAAPWTWLALAIVVLAGRRRA